MIDEAILKGRVCHYCLKPTKHVKDSEVYRRSYGTMLYVCWTCNAYVGCHKSRPRESLGIVANETLRGLKIKAHNAFDQLWKRKMNNGFSKHKARSSGYKWLSEQMNKPSEITHIGMFNEEECQKVVEICKPYL